MIDRLSLIRKYHQLEVDLKLAEYGIMRPVVF
jgi:hypothetical protein